MDNTHVMPCPSHLNCDIEEQIADNSVHSSVQSGDQNLWSQGIEEPRYVDGDSQKCLQNHETASKSHCSDTYFPAENNQDSLSKMASENASKTRTTDEQISFGSWQEDNKAIDISKTDLTTDSQAVKTKRSDKVKIQSGIVGSGPESIVVVYILYGFSVV